MTHLCQTLAARVSSGRAPARRSVLLVPTDMGMKLAADVVAAGLFGSPEAAVGAIIEQTPAGRLGEVSDMADAVVFLASDAARFITGAGLPVYGGMGM